DGHWGPSARPSSRLGRTPSHLSQGSAAKGDFSAESIFRKPGLTARSVRDWETKLRAH
ncbi:unnamed protein product, partial [Heterosigma akashiwo]